MTERECSRARWKPVDDFRVARQADRDAAAVVAVVGLGHDREAEAVRGAHGLALALHQLLARHRQAERGEDAVGLFLVARELDRDVRRAAGDRRLDALLVLAVAELDQRLVVEPQPRDVRASRRRAPATRSTARARGAARSGCTRRARSASPSPRARCPRGRSFSGSSEHRRRSASSPAATPSSRSAYS